MALLKRNVDLGPPLKLSAWRKVAIGTWRTAGDPSVYGIVEVDASAALRYIEKLRQASGCKVTLTHFTGKALGETLKRHPEINCVLRFGKLYPRKSVDVFFQVATDRAGQDLSGTTIRRIHEKTIPEICRDMEEDVQAIRRNEDPLFKKSKRMIHVLPGFLSKWLLNFSGFVLTKLNLWTPLLGTPPDPFGCAMITNIGSLGLDIAFAPLVPYSGVPLLIALGAVRERAISENGQVSSASIIQMGVTFDHRFIDGVHGAKMLKTFRAIFDNPEKELG